MMSMYLITHYRIIIESYSRSYLPSLLSLKGFVTGSHVERHYSSPHSDSLGTILILSVLTKG